VWTYAALKEGIDNVDVNWNDVVQQYNFLSNQGYGESHVTGAAPVVTLTGRRVLGDAAQDYIAGTKVSFGAGRESSLRLSYVDESSGAAVTSLFTVPCTFANIVDIGGGAGTDDSVFSCEVHFKGAPTISSVAPLPPLTVVSVAGTDAGETQIYINPIIGAGNSYVYKTGASVALPELGATLTAGWAALTPGADIAGVAGNQIVVAEIDASSKAVKGGMATITVA